MQINIGDWVVDAEQTDSGNLIVTIQTNINDADADSCLDLLVARDQGRVILKGQG